MKKYVKKSQQWDWKWWWKAQEARLPSRQYFSHFEHDGRKLMKPRSRSSQTKSRFWLNPVTHEAISVVSPLAMETLRSSQRESHSTCNASTTPRQKEEQLLFWNEYSLNNIFLFTCYSDSWPADGQSGCDSLNKTLTKHLENRRNVWIFKKIS